MAADHGEDIDGSRMQRLKAKLVEEAKYLIFVVVYLYVCFGIFILHESIVLEEHQIHAHAFGLAVINALVFAKVMLVAERLPFARRFRDQPLALSILIHSLGFGALFMAFHVLEHVIVGTVAGKTVAESLPPAAGAGVGGIIVMAVIMSVALVPYVAYREISRVFGAEAVQAALFRRPGTSGDRMPALQRDGA